MPDIPLLPNLLVVIAVSLVVVYGLRRLRVPPVVGFLLAGIIIGPGGLGLERDRAVIESLAEIGVILLLFTIGLKFSLQEMIRLRLWVFGAGTAQLALTMALVIALARGLGYDGRMGALLGAMVALSSTAVVLKLQEERGETSTPYGRFCLSVLILQDIAVVPLLLLVPMLAASDVGPLRLVAGLGWSLVMVAAVLLAARLLFPRLISAVARTRSPEVFTLTVILVALGTALISGKAGLSLALGAFLAGVVISETPYAHHVTAQIMPLRDAFSSLFFVSVGMLVEPRLWLQAPLEAVGLPLAVVLLKAVVVTVLALAFGVGGRAAVAAGLALAQVGEFSFILAQAGSEAGLLDPDARQTFLSVSVVTMAATPLLMALGRRLSSRAAGLGRLRPTWGGPVSLEEEKLQDHVVLVGYGFNGQHVAAALDGLGVEYLVLELNPNTVASLQQQGLRVVYGDACQEELLKRASVQTARAMVVSIADAVAARVIAAVARHLNPQLRIIVRTRFVGEAETLRQQGADEVVPEEFETALQLVALVMGAYGASRRAIERERERIRAANYAVLRGEQPVAERRLASLLSAADLHEVDISPTSGAVGQSLRDLDLRARTGALVVALIRNDEVTPNPDPDKPLQPGDILVLYCEEAALREAESLLSL